MHPARRLTGPFALATAAALLLAGCTSGGPAGPGGAVTSPAATVPPSTGAPEPAAPSATPGRAATQAPSSSDPAAAGLATFTFPDGKLSFTRPADWKAEVFEASASPYVGTATIYDASDKQLVSIYYGQIADGVSGPVTRTVFESVPVPGLQGRSTPEAHASFYVDWDDDDATYHLQLTAGAPATGPRDAVKGIILLGDRVLTAEVLFDDQQFPDDKTARAWFAGSQGQALKAILASFTYR
ncbi:conserved hypothetical protein [Pseudarthrobacter chlorophenolicus A6]|uniref:Lipoprotein n=1 Tax=Pseudarthrobacter chlorophenolicus (strain ATCC 700700 / DSM 12829 / CIP 107037 / JCM 12360 / KCTC 9906 / NCIMB 13794 / A6) TaxID=452863 RepID=B8H789_PSECP|nr:hypothetical protein [Pseudarthrobacter chlorophenolicus]ACL41691.1 conserved hypothetical protein [Pseudarthrobacter chlorophenolicus A6]SDQ59969.1 hypothetical protein SAMN04489738_1735 [Pseudarthrobacter chlorophenolicus]